MTQSKIQHQKSNIHLFGIRHHGPGSARSLRVALTELQPDIILVEGPPEANGVLYLLNHPQMDPPISLLTYNPDEPRKAAYFPFAIFSPELQAIRFALQGGIEVRFCDVPQAHRLAIQKQNPLLQIPETDEENEEDTVAPQPHISPSAEAFKLLAEAAGYPDHESWWNRMIEERQDGRALFEAILEVMVALRQETQWPSDKPLEGFELLEARREASMRQHIRQAQQEGFKTIAVVCGAWHTPALLDLSTAAADAVLLADMETIDVEATWVPWTYGRLSMYSGYGAGIRSPGWYHHLWHMREHGWDTTESGVRWLTQVARLLRDEDLDASSAHIIEAVRLAEALAIIRNRPVAGLLEYNEAVQTVMSGGDTAPLRLIQNKLIVSERMGSVPPETPMVPLQKDLERLQKELKLRAQAEESTLKLDLRKELHLQRSHLLHRLNLLRIPWGATQKVRGKRGTFHEVWKLRWVPDFAVLIIEASLWGNTVHDAAAHFAIDQAHKADDLPTLTALLDQIILAELPEVITQVMKKVEETAATSSDIPLMMDALIPLAQVLRYGNVRQTDTAMIRQVVDGLLTRICVGLPSTCASLNDKAAQDMAKRITAVHSVVNKIEDEAHKQAWQETLYTLADQKNIHGLLAGKATRLLLDSGAAPAAQIAQRMRLALSGVKGSSAEKILSNPQVLKFAASWLDGFLEGSALLILHDATLWQILDQWVSHLPAGTFEPILPLLRRTFSRYSEAERRQITEQVRYGFAHQNDHPEQQFDHQQAEAVLPFVAQLLGLGTTS